MASNQKAWQHLMYNLSQVTEKYLMNVNIKKDQGYEYITYKLKMFTEGKQVQQVTVLVLVSTD